VQASLRDKGLTALDKNNIERSRKYAVKVCIEVTLELLVKSVSDKMKTLLLWTGIGTSLETAVLHKLWNVTEQEARKDVDVLWAYGLVQYTDIVIPPQNNIQICVGVHAVIGQYIIESMDSNELCVLSPYVNISTSVSLQKELGEQFQRRSSIHDSSCGRDYLEYQLSAIENLGILYLIKKINMMTVYDPHTTILLLQRTQEALMTLPHIITFFPSLNDDIKSLTSECHKILNDAHKLSRKLNQNVQRCLTQRNYHGLIQTIETYNLNNPIGVVAQQGATMVKKVLPYCDGDLLDYILKNCELLQLKTHQYHYITQKMIPEIKLYIKEHQLVSTSLQTGSPDINTIKQYYISGRHSNELAKLHQTAGGCS